MRNSLKPVILLIVISSLSACATTRPATAGIDENFGAANHANIAAHAITPDPALKENTFIPANRERAKAAREAYSKGEVKDPRPLGL